MTDTTKGAPVGAPAWEPQTGTLDALIIATLISQEVARLQADPDSSNIVDALTARMPLLSKAISTARMAGALLERETHPEAVAARAANRLADSTEDERRKAHSREVERWADYRAAREAVSKCAEGLARAKREHAQLERKRAADREIVLAEGSVASWTDRLAKAEQTLASLEKRK